jgi:hypothetical protein
MDREALMQAMMGQQGGGGQPMQQPPEAMPPQGPQIDPMQAQMIAQQLAQAGSPEAAQMVMQLLQGQPGMQQPMPPPGM